MARRTLVAALALGSALMLSSAMAQKVTLVREGGQFLAAGVREESGQLIFARPGGEVRVEVGSWQSVWVTASDFVALERRDDQGHRLRIYGRDGSLAGEVHVPPGRYGFVTKQRVVATPLSPHGVMVPHELDFYSFDGALVKSVREPELSLFAGMTPMDDGYVVTSSDGPGPEDRTLYFRAAVHSELEDAEGGAVTIGRRATIRASGRFGDAATLQPLVFRTRPSARDSELIVPVEIRLGKATLVLEYHWLTEESR